MDQGEGFQDTLQHSNCKAELALKVIQGRWKLLILRELLESVRRFSDLQRALSEVQQGVSQKVLAAQLRELEADGVVERTVYPEVPPRVEYALTELGRELVPVLEGLHSWGEKQQSEGESQGRIAETRIHSRTDATSPIAAQQLHDLHRAGTDAQSAEQEAALDAVAA